MPTVGAAGMEQALWAGAVCGPCTSWDQGGSRGDLRFVEALCDRCGIPFSAEYADVPVLAANWHCGEEEAGRRFRYDAFERAAEKVGADRIAVAHNLNDLSETMLFHLFRGSGIRGLSGIPAVRGKVIRPLLCVERSEIEAYLKLSEQDFCHDRTNEEDAYTRNRIRHHVIPYVEEHIVSGCVQHMGQAARLFAETEDYLVQQTREAYGRCVVKLQDGCTNRCATDGRGEDSVNACTENGEEEDNPNGYAADGRKTDHTYRYEVDCEAFAQLHPAIRKRLLYGLLLELSPGAKDITGTHVAALSELLLCAGNRGLQLPFGIRANRSYGTVKLTVLTENKEDASGSSSKKKSTWEDIQWEFQIFSRQDICGNEEKFPLFPQNECTKWFDYDKMKKSPIVRTRTEGDFLTIRDAAGEVRHKKLKEYMVNAKIPAEMRDTIPLLVEDSHVIWLVGYRISEYYKVTEQTERILQVRLRRTGENE
ncbi:MAG: tRNA lysidine(34) synthetase TilS [Lachnospiraceae bacterium]|nr:tRNA lysidine(34) synthetase TilS [Lachnospiraceae bacterium]